MEIPRAVREKFATLPKDYFGSIEVVFQHGQPVTLRITETRKLSNVQEQGGRADVRESR